MFPDIYDRTDPEVIESQPPKNSGPYHNYSASLFARGQESLFAKRQGYSRVYLWTDGNGNRILTLCDKDLIKE